MDQLSGLASKFMQGDNQNENKNQGNDNQNSGSNDNKGSGGSGSDSGNSNNNQQEDYLDKGLDSLEKKYGQGKIDPEKMRATNEKITDGAREEFEKVTGHKVPEKFSN